MKKIVTTAISLLGVSLLFYCKSKPQFAAAENGKSLLWEVTGNGLTQPSYFLGTMHLMCAEDAILSPNVIKIIKLTGQVYLEVDMDNAGELLGGILQLGAGGNHKLTEVLSEEEYDRVRNFFEKFQPNMPFSILEKQYPLMISSSLYELFLPCEQKSGVEMMIINEAYKRKKETKGLETFAFQAGIFDSIPYEQQARELVKTIDSLDKYRTSVAEMIAVYKTQDIDKLYEMTTQEEMGMSESLDVLLFKRNRNWVDQFPNIAKQKPTLFAVGAGHLGGEFGVIQLLKNKGYKLRPIKN